MFAAATLRVAEADGDVTLELALGVVTIEEAAVVVVERSTAVVDGA